MGKVGYYRLLTLPLYKGKFRIVTFLYPQFLLALAALGIPVIIHLFNFRKARKIYFSNNRFLQSVRQSTSSRLRIKHLLILCSRLLFLLFLVLTFAQPKLPGREEMGLHDVVYVYLDNSMSMSDLVDNNINGLDSGILHVRDILKTFPRSTRYVFLTNDFSPFSNSPKSSDDLDKYLAQVRFSGQSRSFREVYERIMTHNPSGERRNIYWISDFQVSTLGQPGEVKPDSMDHLYLVPVSFPDHHNIYIDSVFLDNPFLIRGEKNNLNFLIRNDGTTDVPEVPVRLFVNGLQTANTTQDIKAGSSARIVFDVNFPLQPVNKCRLSLDDSPVTFDNDCYFVLTLSNKINIVEIKSSDKPTAVEKVYGNQDLFDFKTFRTGNIDFNLARSADLLVLNQAGPIDHSLMTLLTDYTSHGKTMLVIPDKLPGNSDMVLPGLLLPASRDSVLLKKPLADPDLSNPFFSEIFESTAEKFTMPQAAEVFDLPQGEALLKFRDGHGFISRSGNTYLFSCPLSPDYTDFPNHALFVPVMYRVAMMSRKVFNPLYYTMDNTLVSFRADSLGTVSLVKLVSGNKEIVPAHRVNGNELVLDIPKFELGAGFYDLSVDGTTTGAIAFNYERNESKLARHTPAGLREFFGENSKVRIFNIKDINKFDQVLKENFLGKSLWKYALVLSLSFLLAEILLIRFL